MESHEESFGSLGTKNWVSGIVAERTDTTTGQLIRVAILRKRMRCGWLPDFEADMSANILGRIAVERWFPRDPSNRQHVRGFLQFSQVVYRYWLRQLQPRPSMPITLHACHHPASVGRSGIFAMGFPHGVPPGYTALAQPHAAVVVCSDRPLYTCLPPKCPPIHSGL